MSEVLLELRDVNAWYGKSHVLRGVNMTVHKGEIVGLLGRNGVGRSTTVKAIMGHVHAEGEICFNGTNLVGLKTFEIARKGMGYVPENREIFPTLSVEQNLVLGDRKGSTWRIADMYELFPRLGERKNTPAGSLSGGEQQMLTLSRTLMGDPQCILIDEPTEGLAPLIVAQVARFLERLRDRGVTVVLVEQKLDIALKISRRLYVMGHGHIVFEGTPAQLRAEHSLRKEWLEV
jgi:branched-chain amino acid transport system ATP-binding protein